jgi:hypothetical protein
MRIRLGVPGDANNDEKEAILNAALEAVTRAAQTEVANGNAPVITDAIRANRVRWRPEPPGDEHFDLPSTAMRRGWGDCDDLAPWHAGSLRASGIDPEARAIVRPSAPGRWHALVERSDGSIEDPSLWAGMHSVDGDYPYRGPVWPSMFGDRLAIASYPQWPGYAGRVDVPSASVPATYSMLARGSTPAAAIVGACRGVPLVCGHDAYDEDVVRIAGLHDLVLGVDPREVEEALEHEGYVGFLPMLAPAAASIAAPLASKALSAFGGGGKGGGAPGGGGPPSGSTMSCPGGPIIVRF